MPGVEPEDVVSIATESGVYFEEGEPGFDRLMRTVPDDADGLEALKKDILAYELYRGTLVAEDGSAACILLTPEGRQRTDELYRDLARLLQTPEVRAWCKAGERLVVAGEAAVRPPKGAALSDDPLRLNIVCPNLFVFFIAMRTLKMVGIESKYARFSRLFGGIIMIAIGILLLVKPELLMFG